jgi:hypothetical protein
MCQTVTFVYTCGHEDVTTIACNAVPDDMQYCPKEAPTPAGVHQDAIHAQPEQAFMSPIPISPIASRFGAMTIFESQISPTTTNFNDPQLPTSTSNGFSLQPRLPDNNPDHDEFQAFNSPSRVPMRFSATLGIRVPEPLTGLVPAGGAMPVFNNSQQPVTSSLFNPIEDSTAPTGSLHGDGLGGFNLPRQGATRPSSGLRISVPGPSVGRASRGQTMPQTPSVIVRAFSTLGLHSPSSPSFKFPPAEVLIPKDSAHRVTKAKPPLDPNSPAIFPTRFNRRRKPAHTFRRTELRELCHDCAEKEDVHTYIMRRHRDDAIARRASRRESAGVVSRPTRQATIMRRGPVPVQLDTGPGHRARARRTPSHAQPTGAFILALNYRRYIRERNMLTQALAARDNRTLGGANVNARAGASTSTSPRRRQPLAELPVIPEEEQ